EGGGGVEGVARVAKRVVGSRTRVGFGDIRDRRRESQRAALRIDETIPGDREHPGAELHLRAAELGESARHRDPGLRRDVVGVAMTTAAQVPQNPRVQVAPQHRNCALVTRLRRHERGGEVVGHLGAPGPNLLLTAESSTNSRVPASLPLPVTNVAFPTFTLWRMVPVASAMWSPLRLVPYLPGGEARPGNVSGSSSPLRDVCHGST